MGVWPNNAVLFCNFLAFCHEICVSGLSVIACAPTLGGISEDKYFVQLPCCRTSFLEMRFAIGDVSVAVSVAG